MTTLDKTKPLTSGLGAFDAKAPLPGILVAFAPQGAATVDRCLVTPPFTVGRDEVCDLPIREEKISKRHFSITGSSRGFFIQDLGSTNGTFVNGEAVAHEQILQSGAVIRAGQSVFVFHADARAVLEAPPAERFGMVGRFHSGPFIREIREVVLSGRHLLLAGPSGAGKELTAGAIARMLGDGNRPLPLTAHNAARFASEEEAKATLFGVAEQVFSNVKARPGLIESSHNGVLFLDEVHNLPLSVQRSLLRVIEDGQASRIGETVTHECAVRFVFATNQPPPAYDLAHDLLARLRVVPVPSLSDRVADIPAIFIHVLTASLSRQEIPLAEVLPILRGDHFEVLCLDRFPKDNVRGLIDLSDRLATRMAAGTDIREALSSIFSERFADGKVARRYAGGVITTPSPGTRPVAEKPTRKRRRSSHYLAHKEIIIAAFRKCQGNLSAAERLLTSQGFRCSRRWLGIYLKEWGVK